MTARHTERHRQKRVFPGFALAAQASVLAVLLVPAVAHSAEKTLTDLRLYNYKAANPAATSTSSSSLSSTSADLLDSAVNSTDATDATTTSTIKRAATAAPVADGTKTGTTDSIQKLIEAQPDYGRQNVAEQDIDNVTPRNRLAPGETPGIRMGSFILRPSVSQSVNHESTSSAGTTTTRGYLESGYKAELVSDWALHQLKITSTGAWQTNIYGSGATRPAFDVNGVLRLDISRDLTGSLNAGYSYARSDTTDPNSVSGASVQAPVQTLTGGGSVEKQFGLMRGTVALDFNRTTYGSATLNDGSSLSLADRNQTTGKLRTQLGYEISPALIPFIEASAARSIYDQTVDNSGYRRSDWIYALRAGVQVAPDEKLSGELSAGYQTARFDDARLNDLNAFSVDGNATWSIQRGTDATLGLTTTIDPSTQAGVNGSLTYAANAALTHAVSETLTARLKGSAAFRDYPENSFIGDQTILTAGTGLSWGLNRYLDMTGDVSYEKTLSKTAADTDVLRAGVGLTLKR